MKPKYNYITTLLFTGENARKILEVGGVRNECDKIPVRGAFDFNKILDEVNKYHAENPDDPPIKYSDLNYTAAFMADNYVGSGFMVIVGSDRGIATHVLLDYMRFCEDKEKVRVDIINRGQRDDTMWAGSIVNGDLNVWYEGGDIHFALIIELMYDEERQMNLILAGEVDED